MNQNINIDSPKDIETQQRILELLSDDIDSVIRIGVKIANESARTKTRKIKIDAPLTYEESILMEWKAKV